MNNFADEDNRDNEKGFISLYGISFAKLKAKMTR